MDSARWQRVQTLFHDTADLDETEQLAVLENACGDDTDLLSVVLAMLKQDAQASLLNRSLAGVAEQILTQPAAAACDGYEFGPYRVLRVLGEGGMGIVYLAQRPDLGNQVAIKVLRDAWLSPSRRERFAAEQRTLAHLNHPSIARLYDADTLADGTPWFAMEYVEGCPLAKYCQAHASSVNERLRLFRSVCEAVQYAHAEAVIHRDLKPSNVLVKDDGTVRLLDFGIARQLESLDTPVDQTTVGLRLMTPAYAAPEQIRGDRVGIHTDVYSLGVILYELLTGQLPFDLSNLSPSEAAAIIIGHEPGRPSAAVKRLAANALAGTRAAEIGKNAWADLDVLCLTAMHKDPKRRYRSVEALIRDIDHYLKSEPLEARADSWRYRLGKFAGRNRRAVSAAALVLAVIIGVIVFFTVRLAKARDAALAEAARTQRIQQFITSLFQGGDPAAGPSNDLRVITLLDRGVQEAQSLGNEPAIQAELYRTLGGIYLKLGQFDRADSLLRSALERHRSLFGPDSTETAESLVALGRLRDAQARYAEAETLIRQGLDISQRKLPPNHPDIAEATSALGTVLEDRGAYDQAIQVLGEAVRMRSASGQATPELSSSLTELANSHFYAGHYGISESLNQRVLAMDRQLYGEQHPAVAAVLINLGAIQYDLGYYKEAERYDRQALQITEAWYGKSHPETASALTLLGRALVAEGQLSEAAGLLQEALAIQEHAFGKVHPRVASTLNELGKIAQKQGRFAEAEADFRRMAAIYHSVYGDHHYLIAIALSNLGSVYLEEGQYIRAEELFRDVVRRFTEALSADHLNTGIARTKLGRALLRQHRYQEAEAESRAGYEILLKQPGLSSQTWLSNVRADLAEEYSALKQPEKAAKFRAELAEPATK
jgi:eukaryotic-like serine/threonine-protein kinase